MTLETVLTTGAARSYFGTFSDPAAMAVAIAGIDPETEGVRPVATNSSGFHGVLARGTLNGINVGSGRFAQGIPQTAWIGRVHTFMFSTEPGIERRVSGRTLGQNHIFHFRPNEQTVTSSPPGMPWAFGILSLSFEQWAALEPDLAGYDLDMPSDDDRMVRVPDVEMARLIGLMKDVTRLARDMPQIFAAPAPATALSGTIVDALLLALKQGRPLGEKRGFIRHREIVARFEQVLRERPEDMLSLATIGAAVGVPQRTLNLACQDVLGQSAVHYSRERRLYLVHQRLLVSDPATTRVTDIAMHYGFWELGRFARAYRQRFGEVPSRTLRRSAAAS
jgi:AraC-like DNA-binding protein